MPAVRIEQGQLAAGLLLGSASLTGGIVNAAAAQPSEGGPASAEDILRTMREISARLAARDPGPVAGTDMTVEAFGALVKRGPWPRRVAISHATADAWQPDREPARRTWMPQPTGFGVPVDFDDTVPDGMVRIVEAHPDATRAAATRRFLESRRVTDIQGIGSGPTALIRITGI